MENALKFTKNDVHKLICFLKNKHLILRDLGPNLPLSQQTTRLRNYFAIPNLSIKKISFGIKGLNYFYGDDFKRCDEDVGAMRPKMAIFQ